VSAAGGVVRVYRALLRVLLPRAVWERDGDEMTRTFAEMWNAAQSNARRLRLAASAFGHLPRVALAEWMDGLAPSPEAVARTTRQALRGLVRAPAFSVSAALLLGVGVGAVTTIFTLFDHIVLRALPYPDADRLFVVENGSHSGPDWRAFQALPAVEEWAASFTESVNLTGEGEPARLEMARITPAFLAMFGARPQAGRLLVQDDFTAGDVVVLSAELWRGAFGRDPGVVGRTIAIDGAAVTVVGVVEATFEAPEAVAAPDLWRPIDFTDERFQDSGFHVLQVAGRLRPGATLADAQGDMDAIAEQRALTYPEGYRQEDGSAVALPLVDLAQATSGDVRAGLGLLLGAVALLLLVACANVAHLFMARGLGRTREIAVRRALGAGRGALGGPLAAESLIVGIAGAALGVALARLGLEVFLALNPYALPRAARVTLDTRVLGFATGVGIATALAFGLLPALRVTARDPGDALRAGGRGATGGRTARALRGGLVIAEVALSLVLVGQAGLLLRSFARLREQPLGFRVTDVWTVPLRLPETEDAAVMSTHKEAIRLALSETPGVAAATHGLTVPLQYTGGSRCCWRTDVTRAEGAGEARASIHPISADWFRVFEPAVLAGRAWTLDDEQGGLNPVMLNEPLAIQLFGSAAAAVGQAVLQASRTLTVTGVVAEDVHYGIDRTHGPALYLPMSLVPFPAPMANMAVLAERPPADFAARLRDAVWRADPALPVPEVSTMEARVEEATAQTRFDSLLFGTFGTVALLLAAGGLYGTLLYTVGMERRELGIRLALGAARRTIVARVLGRGLGLAVAGALIGSAGAWAASRLLANRLYRVEPGDPGTLGAAVAVLLGTAAIACWLPARRAAATNPVETLREE
jgi:predicted permease